MSPLEGAPRRAEILQHAMDVVQESGLAALTMKEVARRVGFTEPAVYRYFPAKQALLEGLAERLREMLLGDARAIAAQDDVPVSDRLEQVLRHHIDLVIRTDGLPVLLLSEATSAGDENVLSVLRSIVGEYVGLLEGLLGESVDRQIPVRPREQALLLMGIPAILAIRRRLQPDPGMEDRVKSELLPFLIGCLNGTGAAPRKGDRK